MSYGHPMMMGARDIVSGEQEFDVSGFDLFAGGDDIVLSGQAPGFAFGADPDLAQLLRISGADDAQAASNAQLQALARHQRSVRARNAANQAAFARDIAARGSALVVDRAPTKARDLMLPFPVTVIPGIGSPGAQALVITQPQELFKPHRLVIPGNVGANLTVNDIKIGNKSQFISSGSVPAVMFAENAVDTVFRFDTAEISQQVVVTIQNFSANSVTLFMSMVGKSVL